MTHRRRLICALAGAVGVVAALGAPVPMGSPPTALAAGPSSLELTGHGNGHGIGLSQWGAYGYAADYGWSATQILDHYYGGTVSGTAAPSTVTIRLMNLDDAQTAVVADSPMLVVDGVAGGPWRSVVIRETAERSYTVWARGDAAVCPSASDVLASGWTIVATGLPTVTAHPATDTSASAAFADLAAVCEPAGKVRSYRGSIRAINGTANENRTVNVVPIEQYLRSVVASEMSASWAARGAAALQAQSVAARSYVLAENRYSYAQTCDLVCQFYPGAAWRSTTSGSYNRIEQPAVDTAVQAMSGVVRRVGTSAGPVALTMFSASSGGWTASSSLGFPAVEDLGDSTAGNPRHTWHASISAAAIERAYPSIGTFVGIRVTQRSGQGEWGGRVVTMSVDGSSSSVSISGDQFRRAMGLTSNWFTADAGTTPAPVSGCGARIPPPLVDTPLSTAAADFRPIVPTRLIDTRDGTGTVTAPLGAGCTLVVSPDVEAGTVAVAVNLVTVDPTAQGYLTAYPCGTPRPFTSAVQSLVGRVVSGSAIVPLGADGTFCVFSNIATDVVVDMSGWFAPGAPSSFEPITTVRRFDSRDSGRRLPAGSVVRIGTRGPGAAGPDSTGASVTIHALDALSGGFITAWPCDAERPWASSANVGAGRSVTNYADVAVGSTGEVCVFVSAEMHLAVDLNGWFGPSATTSFHPVVPTRLADTRESIGWSGPFTRNVERRIVVGGVAPIPASARSVVAQLTAVDATRDGYVTVHPCLPAAPAVSMLRYNVATNVAVMVNAVTDGSGGWCIVTNGSAHLLIDVSGWYG